MEMDKVTMGISSLRFVASISVCPSDVQKLCSHVNMLKLPYDPLQNILISPLFVASGTLNIVKQMAEEGKHVLFDSGGYNVQIGRLAYEELYYPLLKLYKENRWADIFTLPDHVPLSQDTMEIVDLKVNNTVTYSSLFFHELPEELQLKAMPVVQGRTFKHIDQCLKAYIKLGVKWIGFGSFGTQGKKSEVNIPTIDSINLAKYVIQVAHENDIRVHLFGLGAPPYIAMIKGINGDSFDSASWLKAAGFGMVSLPFMRFYNISHQNKMSEFQKGIEIKDFYRLCEITGHHCELCNDISSLQGHKMHRAAHNLVVLNESVQMIEKEQYQRIQYIYENGSPKYKGEFKKWLQPN